MMTLLEPAMGAAVLPDVRTVHYVNGLLPSRQYQRASPGVKHTAYAAEAPGQG